MEGVLILLAISRDDREGKSAKESSIRYGSIRIRTGYRGRTTRPSITAQEEIDCRSLLLIDILVYQPSELVGARLLD